ncbi:hydrogenase iron-sulfur subunit [Chloroflexota bacterium]
MHPTILIFACNWNGWSCIEAAITQGLNYPSSVKIVRVNCLARVDMGLILNAFDYGAEGVMMLGCEPGNCHFSKDNEYIVNEYNRTQSILEMLGIVKERLVLVRLPAYDGQQFVAQVNKLIGEIEQIPASRRSKIIGSGMEQEAAT